MLELLLALQRANDEINDIRTFQPDVVQTKYIVITIFGNSLLGLTCIGVLTVTSYAFKYFFYQTVMYIMRLLQYYIYMDMIQNQLKFIITETHENHNAKLNTLVKLNNVYEQVLHIINLMNDCFEVTWVAMIFMFELTAAETLYLMFKNIQFNGLLDKVSIVCGLAECILISMMMVMICDSCQSCKTMVNKFF